MEYTPTNDLPLLQENLIGNANNYYPNKSFGFMVGTKTATVQNVRVDLWDGPTGTYVFPASPIQMSVVSSSASDTLAGTGVQKVHIHYLDTNYVEQSEVISLNGVTPVNTVATNILRINGFHATQVGTGGTSVGNISLTSVGGATTYGFILAAHNTARQAVFTIPAGKTGYISHWQAAAGSATGVHVTEVTLRATSHVGIATPGVFLYVDGTLCMNSGTSFEFDIPVPIPATMDVKISAISDAANANVTAMGTVMGWYE